jgi:hypothetical protein
MTADIQDRTYQESEHTPRTSTAVSSSGGALGPGGWFVVVPGFQESSSSSPDKKHEWDGGPPVVDNVHLGCDRCATFATMWNIGRNLVPRIWLIYPCLIW